MHHILWLFAMAGSEAILSASAIAYCNGVMVTGDTRASCLGAEAGSSPSYVFANVYNPSDQFGSYSAHVDITFTTSLDLRGWWPEAVGSVFWVPLIYSSTIRSADAGGSASSPSGRLIMFGAIEPVTVTLYASASNFGRTGASANAGFYGFQLRDEAGKQISPSQLVPTPEPGSMMLVGGVLLAAAILRLRH